MKGPIKKEKKIMIKVLLSFLFFHLPIEEIKCNGKGSNNKKLPPRTKKWLNLCSFAENGILCIEIEKCLFDKNNPFIADFNLQRIFLQFRGFKAPCHKLDLKFENYEAPDLLGIVLEYVNTPSMPTFKYPEAKEELTYEIIIVDYDRMRDGEEQDWLALRETDIAGNRLIQGFKSESDLDGCSSYSLKA